MNFNMLIFMEANVALHKAGSLKIRYLKNQLRNSYNGFLSVKICYPLFFPDSF